MGAVALLRVAAALTAAVAPAVAAPQVAVVDGRAAGDPAAVDAAVRAFAGAGVVPIDGDRGAALTGRDDDDLALDAALAEASDGYGQLDCGRARPWAETAATLAAGRTAAGLDERARAGRAWTYLLLCADRDGDRPAARLAADRARALGAGAAVPADVWARYPDIDTTLGRDIVALTVTGPAGAVATVDDAPLGAVPATGFVAAGRHLIAVAGPGGRGAAWATALGKPLTVDVPPAPPRDAAVATLAARVRAARGDGVVDAAEADALARAAGVELVAVVDGDGVTVWQRRRGATTRVDHGDAAAMATAAAAALAAAHERAPDPRLPLVRDVPTRKPDRDPTRWWVYAAIGGAVLAGAAAIYAADAGDDHQRFELTFP